MKDDILQILEQHLPYEAHAVKVMIAKDIEDLYLLHPTEEQKGLGILEEAKQWADKQPTLELSGEDARLFALLLSKPDPLDEDE